jgi:hypothetical protein
MKVLALSVFCFKLFFSYVLLASQRTVITIGAVTLKNSELCLNMVLFSLILALHNDCFPVEP